MGMAELISTVFTYRKCHQILCNDAYVNILHILCPEFVRALGEPDPDESEPEDNDVRGSTETAGDQLQI